MTNEKRKLLPLKTRVLHGDAENGHGLGTITGYNVKDSDFYPPERYPYVVQFDSGFREVYAETDFLVLDQKLAQAAA